MKRRNVSGAATPTPCVVVGLVIMMGMLAGTVLATPSWSAGFKSPEECLAYSGDAHLNCLYAYIEIQQNKISKLEEKLSDQQNTTQELQGRLKQQTLRVHALERKNHGQKDKNGRYQFSLIRPYGGFYYRFGSPYYYDPYFGPPFGYAYGSYYPWW
ncbi:MAG: hypothetical protein R3351_07000 [Nitrospirales bacterium]|nr:hypothetical protein [Nitrospirales bacterium]